jgi:hypothetical protein
MREDAARSTDGFIRLKPVGMGEGANVRQHVAGGYANVRIPSGMWYEHNEKILHDENWSVKPIGVE